MQLSQRIHAWAYYRRKSKTKFRIHSPFVYDLIVNIFEDHTPNSTYRQVEERKKQLEYDHRRITRTDFGTGNKQPAPEVKVSSIAKKHSINRRYGRLLFRLSGRFHPKTILELGTSLGISTSYLACACPESIIYTLEGCPETLALARETFHIADAARIEWLPGNFDLVLPGLLENIRQLDLVFMDGNHKRDAVLRYFRQMLPKFHNDMVVIIDDIHWSHDMELAWAEIGKTANVTVTIDLFQLGLVFFKKELSKQDFIIRYF